MTWPDKVSVTLSSCNSLRAAYKPQIPDSDDKTSTTCPLDGTEQIIQLAKQEVEPS